MCRLAQMGLPPPPQTQSQDGLVPFPAPTGQSSTAAYSLLVTPPTLDLLSEPASAAQGLPLLQAPCIPVLTHFGKAPTPLPHALHARGGSLIHSRWPALSQTMVLDVGRGLRWESQPHPSRSTETPRFSSCAQNSPIFTIEMFDAMTEALFDPPLPLCASSAKDQIYHLEGSKLGQGRAVSCLKMTRARSPGCLSIRGCVAIPAEICHLSEPQP